MPVAIRQYNDVGTEIGSKRPENIHTIVIKTTRKISPEHFDLFLNSESIRDSYRIKGYVRLTDEKTWAVQVSFNQINKTEISGYNGNTELILMGPTADAGEINKRFNVLAAG
jgi:G3E family GTPase